MKLVAIDLDGTLLNASHQLSQSTIAAVAEVRAAGVEVVLASSRGAGSMRACLEKLHLYRPAEFISSQGALTGSLDRDGTLHTIAASRIPLVIAHQVVTLVKGTDIQIGWYRGFDWLVPALNEKVEQEAVIVNQRPLVQNLFDVTQEPEKLLFVSSPDQIRELQAFAKTLPDGLTAQFSHANYLEVTRRGVDKGTALKELCAVRGVVAADVVAIGDGFNDIGLFEFAGVSIAMANAPEPVRNAATFATGSNEKDGVASALRMMLRA